MLCIGQREGNRDRPWVGLAWIGNAGDTAFNDLLLSGFAFPFGDQTCVTQSEVGRVYVALY